MGKNPQKRLVDLVRMSIAAHRKGHGDIVWACWQPGGAGVKIKDVRRINSGAMLLMITPRGANTIAQQIDNDSASSTGPMRPWHFDLALKTFLSDPDVNVGARACYIFPPVGNYTTHISGCDLANFGSGAGRPNCWREAWACPGTTEDEDPQQRPKRFLRWNGDKGHIDIGSANINIDTAGHTEWLSW